MKKSRLFSLYTSAVLTFFGGCGTEKGGDHVPTDKTYNVATLPLGSEIRTIIPSEYDTELLGRFVHIAETYRVCLSKERFSDAELANFQSFVSNITSGANQYGLEGLINHSFATLQSFDSNNQRFSSRVSIQFIWNDSRGCDLVIDSADRASFPFTSPDFAQEKRVLFGAGQLVAANLSSSRVPVGYFVRASLQDDAVQIQKLIASYLGYADSNNGSSFLFDGADAASATTWNVVDGNNKILVGDDSLRIYTFAAAWQEVFKPRDLDRYHYYGDSFVKGPIETDSLLNAGNFGVPPTFTDLPGNRYLVGARKLESAVAICYQNDSGLSVTTELVTSWTSFTSIKDPLGVHGKLNALDPAFVAEGAVATTGCQLMISFRNESQYPFLTNRANGFYAHEGSVKSSDGNPTKIPVVYVNASNLNMAESPDAATASRHVSTVIQHEYAHFLGFRHSQNQSSLQSPAGNGTGWVSGDEAFFVEYLKH